MSYRLDKPYTDKQRIDFIVEHNHNQELNIQETDIALYALEAWELLEGDNIIDNTEAWEAEQVQKERDRIDALCLTRSDVERVIYADKGMDFDDLIEYVKTNVPTMDVKALKIELRANNFYRKHPYINQLGTVLGYTSEDLDYLFQNKALPEKTNDTDK